MKVRLTFTEEILGTSSSNPELHEEFIAKKSADHEKIEEEMKLLHAQELVEKQMTIFPKEDGKPFIWDYQIKGFFKDACSMLARVTGTQSKGIKAYKKVIDGLIFPMPRKIFVQNDSGITLGNIQRPLRGQTAQGERISLANSETIPAGSYIEFEILVLEKSFEKVICEWLDYGKLRGLGQWRNSGKGRFVWEEIEDMV